VVRGVTDTVLCLPIYCVYQFQSRGWLNPTMLDDARRRRRKARDARHRARVKRGVRVARVEYEGAILDLLLRTEWAAEAELGDANAVGRALAAMLAASART
jgi:hypothetical protein